MATDSRPGVRVVKLGGSLLDWPEWPGQFRRWRAAQPRAIDVIVVGGGAVVDKIRSCDQAASLPEETTHWLAVRAMSRTAAIAAEMLDEATLVRAAVDLQLSEADGPQILDVRRLLREEQGTAGALPCGWEVTSDSIAARVATALGAVELVLLKSALPAGRADPERLAEAGYVDRYFPRAARGLSVRLVDLRDAGFATMLLDAIPAGA